MDGKGEGTAAAAVDNAHLAEELLRVASYLHGRLRPYVSCKQGAERGYGGIGWCQAERMSLGIGREAGIITTCHNREETDDCAPDT